MSGFCSAHQFHDRNCRLCKSYDDSLPPKPHKWAIKEVDGGSLGLADFWECSECGAGGGPLGGWDCTGDRSHPIWHPFLPGWGLDLGQLPDNCDLAKETIANLKKYAPLKTKFSPRLVESRGRRGK